jgi:hypothetical protein
MTQALATFEAEVGLPLPCSWKSFALACGAGRLCGDWISVPGRSGRVAQLQREWSLWNEATEAQIDEHHPFMDPDVRPWIRHSLQFGTGDNCDFLVWNTTRVTDPARSEYEIVLLNNRDVHRMDTFDSLEAMWRAQVERDRQYAGDEACPFSPE